MVGASLEWNLIVSRLRYTVVLSTIHRVGLWVQGETVERLFGRDWRGRREYTRTMWYLRRDERVRTGSVMKGRSLRDGYVKRSKSDVDLWQIVLSRRVYCRRDTLERSKASDGGPSRRRRETRVHWEPNDKVGRRENRRGITRFDRDIVVHVGGRNRYGTQDLEKEARKK